MPVMDGFDSSKAILDFYAQVKQSNHTLPNCQIVVLTAYTNSANYSKFESLGIKQILHKPAKSSEIA